MGARTLLLAVSVLVAAAAAHGAEPAKDWPCVQVKVPEISWATYWAGPTLEGDAADWQASERAVATVAMITLRRNGEDEVARTIETFAAETPADRRSLELTRLFAAAFDRIGLERKAVIAGIERFTRRQRALATDIGRTRLELEAALKVENPTADEDKARRAIEDKLNWQTRIFDDREKSTTYVCEVPVIIEQRLFFIAREIMNRLEG